MACICARRRRLAVVGHVQGLAHGEVYFRDVGIEGQGFGEDVEEELGVEGDDGAEGELEVEGEVGV